jgi:hypothetical protein
VAGWHRWTKANAGGFELPPEVGLIRKPRFYHPGQNQLIPTLYVAMRRQPASRLTTASR